MKIPGRLVPSIVAIYLPAYEAEVRSTSVRESTSPPVAAKLDFLPGGCRAPNSASGVVILSMLPLLQGKREVKATQQDQGIWSMFRDKSRLVGLPDKFVPVLDFSGYRVTQAFGRVRHPPAPSLRRTRSSRAEGRDISNRQENN